MKALSRLFIGLMLLGVVSCRQRTAGAGQTVLIGEVRGSATQIGQYLAQSLKLLSRKYIAYDTVGRQIGKLEFLKQLVTGDYLFVRTGTDTAKLAFKLSRLSPDNRKKWGDAISAYASERYENYKRVGQRFPAFDFIDIDGKHYNSANTKGKIVVLKYWFVGCQACQEEMPELNRMVAGYKNRDDMVFISIAPDNTSRLRAFFRQHPFDYVKVPDQGYFVANTLKVNEAPTHFVINKQGVIVNVVNNAEELEYALKEDI